MPQPAIPAAPPSLPGTLARPSALLADAAAGGVRPQPGPLELLLTYLPMALIVAVAWLLLYRPERERMKRQQDMLGALKKNDRVVTTSGIYGTVANVDRDADRVALRVDDSGNVKITVTLSSIAKVLGDASDAAGQQS
ncbi:MAG: preprotein translocase subunit YajC [Planctomycetia bacterium]|nr:preprotein translocase subunit YajC [Planctomycetia bacterium]